MQNGQKKGTTKVGRLLSATNFALQLGISEEQLLRIIEKHPASFRRVPRIMGLPRFQFSIWAPVVQNLMTRPGAKQKAGLLPPIDERSEDEKGSGQPSDIITYGESRATRELYSARTAKLDYLRRSGKLVEVSAVLTAWRNIALNVQKAVLAVPDRVAPLCVGEQDLVIIRNRMRSELLYTLKNLSFTIGGTAEPVETEEPGKSTGVPTPSAPDTVLLPASSNPRNAGRKKKVDA